MAHALLDQYNNFDEKKQITKMTHLRILLYLCLGIISAHASIKVKRLYEDIQFPPTESVKILVNKPAEAHLIFAEIEKTGNENTSTLEILSEMEAEGIKLGADAFVLERKVQRFPDGTFIIKSHAVKYVSSIKTLVDKGFVLNMKPGGWHLGTQMDVLPLFLKGVHISAWAGIERIRGQIGFYTMDIPGFYWKDGFQDGRIVTGLEFTGTYFLQKRYTGLHGYLGISQIKGQIGHEEESETGTFKTWNLLFGIGYQRPLRGSFYINTKMAGQFLLSGGDQFQVGTRPAQLQSFSPSVSISFGYQIF